MKENKNIKMLNTLYSQSKDTTNKVCHFGLTLSSISPFTEHIFLSRMAILLERCTKPCLPNVTRPLWWSGSFSYARCCSASKSSFLFFFQIWCNLNPVCSLLALRQWRWRVAVLGVDLDLPESPVSTSCPLHLPANPALHQSACISIPLSTFHFPLSTFHFPLAMLLGRV